MLLFNTIVCIRRVRWLFCTGVQDAFSHYPIFFSCRLYLYLLVFQAFFCFFNGDEGRAFFPLLFPFLACTFCFFFGSLSTMGIVHTVRSRIELWRLERYTKRRTCQLPGYSYKGKNERSNGRLFYGWCLRIFPFTTALIYQRESWPAVSKICWREGTKTSSAQKHTINSSSLPVWEWKNGITPAGWSVQKCHSVSANTESMDRNDIFYPYSLSNKSKSQRTLAWLTCSLEIYLL